MGIFLGLALFVGIIVGVLISAALVIIAIILTKKAAKRRLYVWRVFTCVASIALPVLVLAVYMFPYDSGTPGSNYGILFVCFFLLGLAYSTVPGLSALLAFLAGMACPVNPKDKSDIS